MLTVERREKIVELLNEKGSVSVTYLAKKFETSESTIRRDLLSLAQLGKIQKVHGGATAVAQEFLHTEADMKEKALRNIVEKDAVAKYAAAQIKDDDFVFIDAGTTTLLMIKYLEGCKATFVTNGIEHAKELTAKGCKAFVLGGELKSTTEAIIGLTAATNLQKYNFSKAFIGANGVSEKQGFTTPDTEEAVLKAVAMERSFVSYVICDNTKFNKVTAISFAKLNTACIICDRCDDDTIKEKAMVKEVINNGIHDNA